MPRPTRKPKTKGPRPAADQPNGAPTDDNALATAVAEPPSEEQRPPSPPEEPREPRQTPNRPAPERERPLRPDREKAEKEKAEKDKAEKDHVAASLNIAKLQAMSMTDLNQMA